VRRTPCALIVIAAAAVLALGCRNGQPAPAESEAPSLTAALSALTGTYSWRDDLKRYHYSAKPELEALLAARNREDTVAALVECLDNTTQSGSTLDGTPVALGIVCYEALTQLVYHEPTGRDGDVASDWPGRLSPRPSPAEMRAAKEAWKKVIATKSYSFL